MAVKKIPILRVPVGATLAEDVVLRGQNTVLLGRGTRIDASHIETLRKHRVEIVTIEIEAEADAEPTPPAKLDPSALRELVVQQHRWLGDTRENAVMAEIFRCVVNRAARRAE